MKKYNVTLKHDNGIVKLTTSAYNEQQAREIIQKHENCPESAILKVEIQPYYVVMTDKYLSGWGVPGNRKNKFVIECETYEDAEIIRRNARRRPEMKYINIVNKLPYYSPKGFYISMEKFENLGEIWKK